ncbi:hypothetical protein QBC33DRAFT_532301 [Phialemonium atrogriseum]|uniref:Aminoglycoside phosphotransferase domain-containing protein n=1 Tax=Phialemonium atrogriseum TaxID=1093897 RepID=A0AAJ0C2T1_9PEZI|nr:uncharacterized protein QBC33DRAFT_532301 [Phialemonium atrogriseum]KAK1769115.1 hypothetical protein QBC33DRAFT_532301 [Phialemonium atrogriseum]
MGRIVCLGPSFRGQHHAPAEARDYHSSARCLRLLLNHTKHYPMPLHYYVLYFWNTSVRRLVWTPPEGHQPRARRTRALEGIASAMVQLDRFSFRTGGCLLFGSDGTPSGIGPMRQADYKAMLDRWFVHKDPDDDPVYVECAASSDPKAYFTLMLDRYPEQNPVPKGVAMLLRRLISWIPEPVGMDPFVLAHPDFDIQNVIVSEEGELGLIDWDGVAAVPRSLGNERYPGWLTRDWDPAMYGYKESMDHGLEPEGVWGDSPECLAYYRGVYDGMVARHDRSERGRGADPNLCRMSLITDNLAIAAHDPRCRNGIIRKMVNEIWAAAGRGGELDFKDLAIMFAESNVDVAVMETLSKGFDALLSREGL